MMKMLWSEKVAATTKPPDISMKEGPGSLRRKIGRKVVGTCSKHLKTYAHGKSWKEQSQLEILPGGWQNEPCLNEASAFQSHHLKKLLPRFKDMCMCVKRKTCSMEI